MRIQVARDEKDWVDRVCRFVNEEVHRGDRVFVPAGQTPIPVYARWAESPTAHLRSLRWLQIDDILNGEKRGEFRRFLAHHLATFAEQIEFIDAGGAAADVAILGVGLNGHVAFHEPTIHPSFFSGCVPLSPETCRALSLAESTWGVTYGVGAFRACRRILLLARGEGKRQVLGRALSQGDLPVSWLLSHPDVTLITDFALP